MVKVMSWMSAVVGLGLTMVGGRIYAADIYVDVFGDEGVQDGTQEKPYVTIQSGVEAASAGDVVWVKSGEGRDYAIVDDAGAVSIPEEKSGLVLRGWGEEKALISCTNKYEYTKGDDGVINWINKTVSPLTVEAPNVVLRDLRLVYTDNSMTAGTWAETGSGGGTNYVAYVQLTETAIGSTIRDCTVEALERHSGYGAGTRTGIINVKATGVCFEENEFIGCYFVVGSRCDVSFVGNYLTNTTELVANTVPSSWQWDYKINVTVVSNVFVNNGTGCLQGSNQGIGTLKLAYNIFYNDETAAGRSLLTPWKKSISELECHHNTIIGWKYVWVYYNYWGYHQVKIYDNVIWLEEEGALLQDWQLWDNDQPTKGSNFMDAEGRWIWQSVNNESVAVGTFTEESSFIRNNVVREGVPLYADPYHGQTKYGENLFDADWAYTCLTGRTTVVGNVYLSEAPVFVSLEVGNENFMTAKQNKNRKWADKKYAWGGVDGTAELFIGAKPIIQDTALVIRVQ